MPNSRQTQSAKARQSAKRKQKPKTKPPLGKAKPASGGHRRTPHTATRAHQAATTPPATAHRTPGQRGRTHENQAPTQRRRGKPRAPTTKEAPKTGGKPKGTQQNSKPRGSRTAKPARAPPQPGEAHEPRSTARAATQARHTHAGRSQQLSCRRWPARSAAGPKPHSLPWEHDAG